MDGTTTLSYHACGVALDILPRSCFGKQVSWRWARSSGLEWYALGPAQRFAVPEAFIRAFEHHGFVWGGKWQLYDAMHFEYRPEILLLNGYGIESGAFDRGVTLR